METVIYRTQLGPLVYEPSPKIGQNDDDTQRGDKDRDPRACVMNTSIRKSYPRIYRDVSDDDATSPMRADTEIQ